MTPTVWRCPECGAELVVLVEARWVFCVKREAHEKGAAVYMAATGVSGPSGGVDAHAASGAVEPEGATSAH